MRIQEIMEALRPSEYRKDVQGWDKSKYNDIFGGKYRIELPTPSSNEKIASRRPNQNVINALTNAGFEVVDYLAGTAKKIPVPGMPVDKREYKLGKVLRDPAMLNIYAADKVEKTKAATMVNDEYQIIISRHPYDVAGMSTDRDWPSCMNLGKVGAAHPERGVHADYVAMDVKEGTIVAYLVHSGDTNIKNPAARLLIKPFSNLVNGDIALGIEDRVYGKAPSWFAATVSQWADRINASKKLNGIFHLSPELYNDTALGGAEKGTKVKIIGNMDIDSIVDAIAVASAGSIQGMLSNGILNEEVLIGCAALPVDELDHLLNALIDYKEIKIDSIITPKVQSAWCTRKTNDSADVIDLLLKHTIPVCEDAVLTAIQNDVNTLRILVDWNYEPRTQAIEDAGIDAIMAKYTWDDMTGSDYDELTDAFDEAGIEVPPMVDDMIAADNEWRAENGYD